MIIYKITNTTNGKIYIGKTKKPIDKRWRKHLCEAKRHDRRHLYRAINKYGANSFNIETIEECSESDVSEREKYWIKYYNSTDRNVGYNLTEGGENGHRSEEYRRRISETLKQYFRIHGPPPNPTKGKFGMMHHFYGKHHTRKTKETLSSARLGKKYEEVMDMETANKLKLAHKEMWKGRKNPSFREIPMLEIITTIHHFPLVTIDDICSKYEVSRPTVINKFKQHTGMTFEQYKKYRMGFNHGIYKRLKNLGIDKVVWMEYSSEKQCQISCTNERSNNTENPRSPSS